MTESMVTRVALAIKRHQLGAKAELATEGPWLEFELDSARAAIEAMREMTDLMGLGLPEGYRPGSHSASEIWRALVRAALEEGKQ